MVNSFTLRVLTSLLVLAVTVLPAAISAATKDLVVSFAEAWNMVDAQNDALKAARMGVDQARHNRDGAKDLYLPEISLSASYLYLDDAVELSPSDLFESMEAGTQASYIAAGLAQSYGMTAAQLDSSLTSTIAERDNFSSSLTASWPIYTGGRISAAQNIAAGQLGEASSQLSLKKVQQFETLVKYYFGAVLTNKIYVTRQDAEAGLRKHRDHAVLLEEQGQIAKVERMQSEAAYDKAVVELKKAYRDLEIARVALSRMLKSEYLIVPGDPLFIVDTFPVMEKFLGETLKKYPGLHILDAKKEQAAGLAAVEKGKYFPSVALFGRYSVYEEDDLASKLVPDWMVGVGVKIPLLERSGRSGKLDSARSALKRIEFLQNQAESDLSVLVEKSYRHVQQAVEEYDGLHSSQDLANETVNLRRKAFTQGLSTSLDVVDAEMFLAQVKTQRAAAVYNYVLALGKLVAISADPEEFFIYQKNSGIEDF